ncbi:MAG: hypothetical protein U0M02_06870 [Acutalibacteraceae bacterium]|nr:hypothetical protein [Acutalibacteraceae bacterium]
MKQKKKNREEVRENALNVPMTLLEKLSVQKAADNIGISMSAFVRMALNDYMKRIGEK